MRRNWDDLSEDEQGNVIDCLAGLGWWNVCDWLEDEDRIVADSVLAIAAKAAWRHGGIKLGGDGYAQAIPC